MAEGKMLMLTSNAAKKKAAHRKLLYRDKIAIILGIMHGMYVKGRKFVTTDGINGLVPAWNRHMEYLREQGVGVPAKPPQIIYNLPRLCSLFRGRYPHDCHAVTLNEDGLTFIHTRFSEISDLNEQTARKFIAGIGKGRGKKDGKTVTIYFCLADNDPMLKAYNIVQAEKSAGLEIGVIKRWIAQINKGKASPEEARGQLSNWLRLVEAGISDSPQYMQLKNDLQQARALLEQATDVLHDAADQLVLAAAGITAA